MEDPSGTIAEVSEENGFGLETEEPPLVLPDLSFSFNDMTDLAYPSVQESNGTINNGRTDSGRESTGAEDHKNDDDPATQANGTDNNAPVNGQGDNGTNRWTEMVAELGEPLEIMEEMSSILNTGLKQESLYSAFKLLQSGADHRVLAQVIKQWRDQKREKPQKKLGHYFDTAEEEKEKKPEWLW